jgi:tetratricopeptide (TPR) repeat protein
MKKVILSILCSITLLSAFGQDAKDYYEQAMEKAQYDKLEEAIKLFDKSIELNDKEYVAWYNRGIAKSMLNLYEDALSDFEQTIQLNPTYKKGYLNRGIARKNLTNYEGALTDYTTAIKLDPNYTDAYFNRGLLNNLLSKRDSACLDFNKAKELGSKAAIKKVDWCKEPVEKDLHPILSLTKVASNNKYGFTSENPIKVGAGPDGGPSNERAYLNLLRDKKGKPIEYVRRGSCCEYKSDKGLFGSAMLDKYEITYLNDKGEKEKSIIYISFYDYEEPKILFGFKTVGQK